jgi:hypothetical protein
MESAKAALDFALSIRLRSCWNVGIATRFPRAVGRVENLILVFHAFHGPSFQQLFSCLCDSGNAGIGISAGP